MECSAAGQRAGARRPQRFGGPGQGLAYDNALDALAIRLPLPDQRLGGKTVEVAEVAPLGARLFVNGTPAPLDDKGRFALKLGGAPRVLVFRLVRGDGTESYWIAACARAPERSG